MLFGTIQCKVATGGKAHDANFGRVNAVFSGFGTDADYGILNVLQSFRVMGLRERQRAE